MNINLLPFQSEDVNRALRMDHFGFFWEQGLGKTVASIYVLLERDKWPALIVCPKTVISVWEEHLEEYAAGVRVVTITGTRKQKMKKLEMAWGHKRVACIINYMALVTFNYQCVMGRRRWTRNHLCEVVPWQAVVADESSYVKHRRSERSKALHCLNHAPYRLALSGTPVTKGPTDLWSQFKYLKPGVYHENYRVFSAEYEVTETQTYADKRFTVVKGYKNTKKLYALAAPHVAMRKKHDCLPDLPGQVWQREVGEMTPAQADAYRGMAEEMVTEVGDRVVSVAGILPKIERLQEIANGFLRSTDDDKITWFDGNPKQKMLLSLFERVLSSMPIVVFYQFTPDLKTVERALHQYDRGSDHRPFFSHIDGMVKPVQRREIIHEFQAGNVDCLALQIQTGAFGITLTRSPYAVFISNPWNLDWRLQAEARQHRIGTTSKVSYIDLVMEGTIDETASESLKKKRKYADSFEFTLKEARQRITGNELRQLVFPKGDK